MPYLFTSKELDEETGLYYFGARYYDPRTSVWESTDPALGAFLSGSRGARGVYVPAKLGLYGYAGENPLRLVDRNGLDWSWWEKFKRATERHWAKALKAPKKPSVEDLASGRPALRLAYRVWKAAHRKGQHVSRSFAKKHPKAARWLSIFDTMVRRTGGIGLGTVDIPPVGEGALATAEEGSTLPDWVNSGGAVVRHAENLQKAGETVSAEAADELVRAAREHGVKVRLDPPHPGTPWDMPHLNVGAKGQAHVPVPEGYKLPQ